MTLRREDGIWRGEFQAMASPCEVLVDSTDPIAAQAAVAAVAQEALRIEAKFSRYRDDNLVHRINSARGQAVEVDEEFARLFDFAAHCFQLSNGRFDITSGVLRRVWRFDGSDRLPTKEAVREVLQLVGWQRVRWRAPVLQMPAGMEIDLGGIGKEYAVDRAAQLAVATGVESILVNFGGDIYAAGPRRDGGPWQVQVDAAGSKTPAPGIPLRRGGIATSGDATRFLFKDGKRYSHILDPRTGWPVDRAPHSVTVLEANCTQAGLLSTLAMLEGRRAEKFLRKQRVQSWVIR